jgi:Tfp pilus assembly protein PilX
VKQAIRKLHTQRGASLLVALMFFLVCAMVAAVIVGSATTNAMKLQQRKEDKQVYNSVSSAAKLLRDKVGQLTMEGSESKVHYGCNDYTPNTSLYSSDFTMSPAQCTDSESVTAVAPMVDDAAVTDDPLLNLLAEGAQKVFQSELSLVTDQKKSFDGWNSSFTIDDGKCTVNVEVSIKDDYSLTFRLTPAEDDLDDAYAMTLTCEGKSDTKQTEEQPICTHTVTLQPLDSRKTKTSTSDFTGTKKTITTTISWQTGVIEKGVSSDG